MEVQYRTQNRFRTSTSVEVSRTSLHTVDGLASARRTNSVETNISAAGSAVITDGPDFPPGQPYGDRHGARSLEFNSPLSLAGRREVSPVGHLDARMRDLEMYAASPPAPKPISGQAFETMFLPAPTPPLSQMSMLPRSPQWQQMPSQEVPFGRPCMDINLQRVQNNGSFPSRSSTSRSPAHSSARDIHRPLAHPTSASARDVLVMPGVGSGFNYGAIAYSHTSSIASQRRQPSPRLRPASVPEGQAVQILDQAWHQGYVDRQPTTLTANLGAPPPQGSAARLAAAEAARAVVSRQTSGTSLKSQPQAEVQVAEMFPVLMSATTPASTQAEIPPSSQMPMSARTFSGMLEAYKSSASGFGTMQKDVTPPKISMTERFDFPPSHCTCSSLPSRQKAPNLNIAEPSRKILDVFEKDDLAQKEEQLNQEISFLESLAEGIAGCSTTSAEDAQPGWRTHSRMFEDRFITERLGDYYVDKSRIAQREACLIHHRVVEDHPLINWLAGSSCRSASLQQYMVDEKAWRAMYPFAEVADDDLF